MNSIRLPSRTGVAATALVVLLLVFFVGGTVLLIWNNYRYAEALTRNRASLASEVVSTNVGWVMEVAQQILGAVDAYGGDELEFPVGATRQHLLAMTERLPGSPQIYVVRADGKTTLTTDPQIRDIDIRDREYFQGVAKGKRTHVSALLSSRLNNEQIFVISRRIERDGQFAAAAMISFNAQFMKRIWESLAFDQTSTVSLLRDDGQLVMRYPPAEGPLDLSRYVLFTSLLSKSPSGVYDAVSPADNVTRVVAYRRVGETGLIALSSMGTVAAFAPFWSATYATLAIAIPVGLFLLLSAFLVFGWLRRDALQRARLSAAFEANQMLFREIHHRVKNNLQAVASLINLQKLEPVAKRDMMQRVQAMVAVHEHIYRNDEFATVDASIYLPTIAGKIAESYGGNVLLQMDVESVIVDREAALPLGLIVNEIVSNALKYAFPDGKSGSVWFALRKRSPEAATLVIRDDGTGFDPEKVSKGMGSRLVKGLAAQLQGKYRYSFEGGTKFTLDFPLNGTPVEKSA